MLRSGKFLIKNPAEFEDNKSFYQQLKFFIIVFGVSCFRGMEQTWPAAVAEW